MDTVINTFFKEKKPSKVIYNKRNSNPNTYDQSLAEETPPLKQGNKFNIIQ